MAKPKVRKLKVFQAQIGFYDTVVAAPSQAAAARAWGFHRNPFASGDARAATDSAAIEAALAQPDVVLKRPVGSGGAFEADPAGLPDVPEPMRRRSAKAARKRAEPPPAKPPPDRAELDRAEAGLRALGERWRRQEADFRERRATLEEQALAAKETYAADLKAAQAAVKSAKAAYRKAGGRE